MGAAGGRLTCTNSSSSGVALLMNAVAHASLPRRILEMSG
jgi:hypothetical protein